MKEVVINTCFGGFGLSGKAMKMLVERGSKAVKEYSVEEYCGEGGRRYPSEREIDLGDGFSHGWIEDVLYKDDRVFTYCDDEREDPDLIAVVRELGDEAGSKHAKLKIVEVPDDLEYEIQEYDGNEHIAEKHRTWS